MVRGVSRCWNDQHVARIGEGHAARKGTHRWPIEADEFRVPPLGPTIRQVSHDFSHYPAGTLKFLFSDPGPATGQVREAACVISVQMGQNDVANVSRVDATRPKLRADLFFGMNGELHSWPIEGVPCGVVARVVHARSL